MKQNRNKRGMTLLETMMAMVILAAAAAGILLPTVYAAGIHREATKQVLGARLASDLLEQIRMTPFENIASTYDGYTEAAGQVKNALGAVFSDPVYSSFGRSVRCQTADVAGVDMLWITATVFYDGNELAEVKTLIGPE